MTVSLIVNFNDGSGWLDFSSLVRACPRTERACSENFTHAVSQCDLSLRHEPTFLAKLAVARGDVDVILELDGQPYFAGRIPPSVQFESSGADAAGDPDVADLEIEVLDYSARLEREITEDDDIAWENQAVCDPGATGASIVHRLLALCGLTGASLNITPTISTVLAAFALRSGTVGQVLDTLLMEYGYTYRFDRQARVELIQTIIETPVPTVDLDENLVMATLKAERIECEFDAARVIWYSFHSKDQALVYLADLPIGDNNRYSGYAIQPTFLWPPEANVGDAWLDYQDNGVARKVENGAVVENKDFSQIVLTKNHTVDESFEVGINRETTIFKNKRARITYRNPTGASKLLFWLGIYADVIYLGAENEVQKDVAIDPQRIGSYTASFVHDVVTATRLACARADRFNKAAWRFTFKSQAEIAPGTIGALSDPYSGLEGTVMVLECQTDPENGIYSTKAISIADVLVDPTFTKSVLIPTVPQTKAETPSQQLQNVPTFQDLDQGYQAPSGGTTVPTARTILLCRPVGMRAIELRWDRQLNLTNLAGYQVRVSDDDATWYALRFDGVDWKGAAGGVTDWHGELLIHNDIPNGGTAEDPVGRTLYYQVRPVTKEPLTGPWSVSASSTTKTVAAGDLAANSVYVNNLVVGFLQAAFGLIDTLVIGYYSPSGTGTPDAPVGGDRRIFLEHDAIKFQTFTNGGWSAVRQIQLGGSDSLGNFLPFIASGGIVSDAADAPTADPIPDNTFFAFDFENNTNDQYGNDPFTVTSPIAFGSPGWKNSYYEDGGEFQWTNVQAVMGTSFTICAMLRIPITGYVPSNIFKMYLNANNYISFTGSLAIGAGNSIKLEGKQGGVTFDTGDLITLDFDTWNFVALIYDSVTNNVSLRANGSSWTVHLTGAWGVGAGSLVLGGTLRHYRFDDLIFSASEAIDPDIFLQHYLRGQPWTDTYYQSDIIIQAKTGKNVRLAQATLAPARTLVIATGQEAYIRRTITDPDCKPSSTVVATIQRNVEENADMGWVYTVNVAKLRKGSFDVIITCAAWGTADTGDEPPDENITLSYILG